MVIAFVCAFEFGPGPIVWLYISEVSNDKAASVATFINWVFTLIVSILSSYMIKYWFGATTWLIIAALSGVVSTKSPKLDVFNRVLCTSCLR